MTSANLQTYADKVEVIPLGLDEGSYPSPTAEDLSSVKRKYQSPYFLFIGVLRYYKGLHILVEAAKQLECDIVIAGAGPVESQLKKQVAAGKIENVFFEGRVSDGRKAALLGQCLGVVFPSHLRSEAFGVTLLEGALFGKPLISTELGTGTSKVNIDGETGFVVPPGNPVALAEAMACLYNRPDKAKEMGLRSRQRYEKYFSGQVVGENYASLYQSIAEE